MSSGLHRFGLHPRLSRLPASSSRACCRARSCRRVVCGVHQERQEREIVVGIDLGTTNSAVARYTGRKAQIIKQEGGASTVPSVVAYLPDGEVETGKAAQRQAGTNALNTFYSVKRFIGRELDKLPKYAAKQVPYLLEKDEDGDIVLKCSNVPEGKLYPEEVSGRLLAHLLTHTEQTLRVSIKKAVISVPAYFDENQKDATTTAGKIAGLQTVRLIREPVAAALAYGINVKEDQTVLVLDLGGGTYDISILEVGGGVVEVLATGGDTQLGGDDFDNVIVDWLIKDFLKPAGIKWRNPGVISQLKSAAEAAKIRLSQSESVSIGMPFKGRDGQPMEAILSQQDFEGLSRELFRRARLPLDEACWQLSKAAQKGSSAAWLSFEAGVDLGTARDDQEVEMKKYNKSKKLEAPPEANLRPKRRAPISQVLLVGGSTRMPAVRRFVQNMTGLQPATFVQPDEAVALGAAVQAGILEGQVSNVMVMDIWQASLMRAFAKQRLKQDKELAAAQGIDDFSSDDDDTLTKDEVDEDDAKSNQAKRSSLER